MAQPEPDSDQPGRDAGQPLERSQDRPPSADASAGVSADLRSARALAERLGGRLRAAGLRLATAESCTGGLLGALLTHAAGSSDYYLGGVIAYANPVKIDLLDVSAERLASEGAVSRVVARQMALGIAARLGSELAVSVTGIAGPGGGSVEKPVGTVWIAWLSPAGERQRCFHFEGDRAAVRAAAATAAFQGLLESLGEP